MAVEHNTDEHPIIIAAYARRVQDLFLVLAEALATGEPERNALERFRRALRSAKKARDMALLAAEEEQTAAL